MRKLIALIATGMVALALSALPAVAEDTTVDFTITATNGLQLSQGSTVATLTDGSLSFTGDTTVSGTLPETTVTDERGDLGATWTVQVSAASAFTNNDEDTVTLDNAHVYLPATDLTDLTTNVLSGAITGMTVVGAELTAGTNNLSTAYTLIHGTTSDLGLGAAPNIVYTPSMDVTVPQGTPVGTYSTTVTQTVS